MPVASVCGAPPPTSIRFNLPSAKYPTDRLSGDQNGVAAPSVPASGCADVADSDRSQRREGPLPDATKTIWLPSGESENENGSVVGGVTISVRISDATGGGASRRYRVAGIARASSAITRADSTIQRRVP